MRKTKTCHNACNELPMTLKLCSETIVLEAVVIPHNSDEEFKIVDSAHEAKNRRK